MANISKYFGKEIAEKLKPISEQFDSIYQTVGVCPAKVKAHKQLKVGELRCLADFERELNEAPTLEGKFKVIFEGLILNVFTCGLKEIGQLNLATLEIRNPEVYETVKDKEVREALVRIGIFDVDVFKNPNKNAVELGFGPGTLYEMGSPDSPLFEALYTIGAYKFKDYFETQFGRIISVRDLTNFYGGPDAVKVFLKALYVLCKLMCRRSTYPNGNYTYVVDEESSRKLKAWLELDKIEYVTHQRRIENGLSYLGGIYLELEKHKRTIKEKLGLILN